MLSGAGEAPASGWHTSPECWSSPRYTQGPIDAELAARVRFVDPAGSASSLMDGERSPNGGYRYLLQQTGADWQLLVDVEQGRSLRLQLSEPASTPTARWINEKLIYLRVAWGRHLATDLIVDVERRELIYHERTEEGSIAFEQYRQACGGQCPCPTSATAPALASPTPGASSGQTAAGQTAAGQTTTNTAPAEAPEPLEDGLRMTGLVRPGAVQLEALPLYAAPQLTAARIDASGLQLRQREASYEDPALLVYGRRPGWYRLRLNSGVYVWAQAAAMGEFMPLRGLLVGRLNHLSRIWDGRLWDVPEGTASAVTGGGERAVELLSSRRVEGRLWIEVALYKDDPCRGGDRGTAERGWVSAHDDEGEPLVWFWARGC